MGEPKRWCSSQKTPQKPPELGGSSLPKCAHSLKTQDQGVLHLPQARLLPIPRLWLVSGIWSWKISCNGKNWLVSPAYWLQHTKSVSQHGKGSQSSVDFEALSWGDPGCGCLHLISDNVEFPLVFLFSSLLAHSSTSPRVLRFVHCFCPFWC